MIRKTGGKGRGEMREGKGEGKVREGEGEGICSCRNFVKIFSLRASHPTPVLIGVKIGVEESTEVIEIYSTVSYLQ